MAEADPGPLTGLTPVREIAVADAADLSERLRGAERPFIIRGLVKDWPLVQAGLAGSRNARDYLLRKRQDRPFTVSIAPPDAGGRLWYTDDFAMNFRMAKAKLPEIFQKIDEAEAEEDSPAIYLASIDMHEYFDGLVEENDVDLSGRDPLRSIWIGTATRIAAHNDFPDNLACCAVGRRRFTLFPPDQFRNLYLGPVDNTPAGRAVSMVDFAAPDYDAHPRFREALAHAQVAELEPGDALFIPSMWWHHVEGLSDFNVLVNYWWRDTPRWLGQPQDALNHAMMSIRDLPEKDRAIWRDLFEHYVFGAGPEVTDHIPEKARSVLGPLTPESAGRIRAFLLRSLSR
ncbi:cupin-like domain-containing protein [Croceicoccus mobilis]|uniref:Cupin n=1 Tax=Croceicoccus mobilis TaxID=1703339 RepID=A0A917DTP1_9SPHN|nr:cupin-like domain-containing protein [Croceicoccus mobilis]GGD66087.1 cupin [Croceicoccus mobilis]